ncbi:cupin domain-containing protein [Undibacterium fentianense]|uniref:Cupin domain-containing protein n=1 Tax=Undibacterium fentianense TaxID=2828728 RepID=A0A941DXV6_9BURK|nr:cupin domain-containing protein [Undibacterium fentianense]MBR7798745.1 cupin domain-containing protein [Undibacterium fentianense]
MKKSSPTTNLLGGISVDEFFQTYWQKKPLLIRQAIPQFKPLFQPEELFEMAARDDVESRLICFFKQHWEMKNGPITTIPVKEKKDWTLLVQGVNLHQEKANDLLRQFRFVPDARLDDLMISYAVDGGGVGPHFDSYDVFLLQAHGQRRWRISAQKDLSLIEGMPLKILRNFQSEQEFILEPGDMLYLPPQYAHDGIAIGECMTYSIGFRSPSYQELGEGFLQFMADTIDLPGRYADPELKTCKHPAEIHEQMMDKVCAELLKIQLNKDDMSIFLGEYLTEPKSSVFFESPEKPFTPKKFTQQALKLGVKLALKTQMLYYSRHIFINGESFSVGRADKQILSLLANQRKLNAEDLTKASDDVLEAFCIWYEDGWLELAN